MAEALKVWQYAREAARRLHERGQEWRSFTDLAREVRAQNPGVNEATLRLEVKYHCINDPTKRHSPALQYRRNPLFVTDDPRARGKR